MNMKTAIENIETKIVFLSETENENDFSPYGPFLKITVFIRYLLPVLPYLKSSPTHAFPGPIARGGSAVGIGSLRPCTSTILNGMLVYI